jgi:hypothetical protein
MLLVPSGDDAAAAALHAGKTIAVDEAQASAPGWAARPARELG